MSLSVANPRRTPAEAFKYMTGICQGRTYRYLEEETRATVSETKHCSSDMHSSAVVLDQK